jgi:hypothetical protein
VSEERRKRVLDYSNKSNFVVEASFIRQKIKAAFARLLSFFKVYY